MKIVVSKDAKALGCNAADYIAELINEAIATKGEARIILSTGASQLTTIEPLIERDIDWSKVTMFHLDEYVNLPETHIASFRKYLKERFIQKINLKAGEKGKVEIVLDGESFQYYDPSIDELSTKPGRYQILYGTSSLDKDLKTIDFVVK